MLVVIIPNGRCWWEDPDRSKQWRGTISHTKTGPCWREGSDTNCPGCREYCDRLWSVFIVNFNHLEILHLIILSFVTPQSPPLPAISFRKTNTSCSGLWVFIILPSPPKTPQRYDQEGSRLDHLQHHGRYQGTDSDGYWSRPHSSDYRSTGHG